jgi:hypothetical protein
MISKKKLCTSLIKLSTISGEATDSLTTSIGCTGTLELETVKGAPFVKTCTE